MNAPVNPWPADEMRYLNERLNRSEEKARAEHGRKKITSEIRRFRKRAKKDSELWGRMYADLHPYQWMIDSNAKALLDER